MKDFGLKFVSVFIILMFCLVPLSAADLNAEDNNNKYDNNNIDNLDVDDVNITVDDSESKNEMVVDDSSSEMTSDAGGQKTNDDIDSSLNVNKTSESSNDTDEENLSLNVGDKYDPDLRIKVRGIVQGQTPVAELTANSTFNGKVCIKLKGSSYIHYAYIVNGSNNYTLDSMDNLKPGNYTVTVTYDGDAMFKESESSTTFTVYYADPNLNIKVNDIVQGQRAVAEITADSRFRCYMTLKINPSGITCQVPIINGHGKYIIDKDLLPGNYTATVSYNGDEVFKPSESSTTFTVSPEKVDPKLGIKVNDIVRGQRAVAEVTANSSLNGQALVKVNGSERSYRVDIVNGSGNVTIDEDLLLGNHTVTVAYDGDAMFKESESSTTFTVSPEKVDPNLRIKVNDIVLGQKPVVEITADSSLNGPVRVKVNGSKYTYSLVVVNGSKKYTLFDDLKPGTYTATASYEGDDVFKPSESSTTFTVAKVDPKLNIKVRDVVYGKSVVAELTADSSLNGPALVVVNTSLGPVYYHVNIVKGEAKTTIHERLGPGNYTATASYEGDDVFKPSESSATFTVAKVDPKLGIKVNDIVRGQRAVAEVTANSSLNGPALVKVNGSENTYRVDIVKGSGNVTIDEDLLPDNHTVTVAYDGDELFKESESSTRFTLYPGNVDPNLRIKVKDIVRGQKPVAEITANNTLNGVVRIKVNGTNHNYNLLIVNGSNKYPLFGDLKPGNYTVTVTYGGDDVFRPSESSTTFTVSERVDSDLKIKADGISNGQSEVAEVTANDTLNGLATDKINPSDIKKIQNALKKISFISPIKAKN